MDAEEMDNKISITHKCYIKNGDTLFTRSSTLYSTIPSDIDISNLGLVHTSNVIPQVLRKRTNITNKLQPFAIKEIQPFSKPYVISARKRKLEIDEMAIKKRKMEFIEGTLAIKEGYKVDLAKEQEIKAAEEELTAHFRQRWIELDSKGFYKLYAFVVNSKENFTYVGVLAEIADIKTVYYLKGPYKTRFIELSKDKDKIAAAGFVTLPYTTKHGVILHIVYLPTKEPICTFTTNGISMYNGNTFPKIEQMQFQTNVIESKEELYNAQMDVEQVHNTIMQSIVGTVKVKQCSRLEELEEGAELLITAIRPVDYKKKTRYILTIENIQRTYVSNYWLEKEIQDQKIDLNYKIKIKCDKLKTTPSKNMERLVFCTQ